MADKEVKVKIIADISKFEKAIDELQDTLKDLTKSFKDIAKQNFTNIEKSFDKANDKAQDLQKTIDNLGKEIKDVAKQDIDGLSDSFDDAKKSVDKLADGVGEFKESINDANRNVDELADNLTSMKTNTFETLNRDVNNFKEDIQTADKEVEQLQDSLNSIKANAFDTISRDMNEFKEDIQTTQKEVGQLKDNLNETDSSVFDKLTRSGNNLKELFSDLSKKLKLDNVIQDVDNLKSRFSKLDESFNLDTIKKKLTDMKEGLLEIGSSLLTKVANKFNSIYDGGKEGNTIFSKLKNTIQDIWQGIGNFGGEIKANIGGGLSSFVSTFADIFTAIKLGTRNLSDISAELNQANRTVDNLEEKFEKLERTIRDTTEEVAQLRDLMDTTSFENPEDYYDTLERSADAEKKLKRLTDELERQQKELESAKEKAQSLQKEFDDFGNSEGKFKGITEAVSKVRDVFDKLKGGDIAGAWEVLKTGASTTAGKLAIVATAVGTTITVLNKLAQAGKQRFFEGLETVEQIFQPLINFGKSVGMEIKTAFENIGGMQLDLSSAIETTVEFESTIAQVGAICGATGDDLDKLSNVAREWGATTRYSGKFIARLSRNAMKNKVSKIGESLRKIFYDNTEVTN